VGGSALVCLKASYATDAPYGSILSAHVIALIKKESLQRDIEAIERENNSGWGKTRQQLITGLRRLIALSARLKH
jgi:hypothetical protein